MEASVERMMKLFQPRIPIFCCLAALLLLSACVPLTTPTPATDIPTRQPTVTETALFVPPTQTPTLTPLPSPTPTPTALPIELTLSSTAYRLPPIIRALSGESVTLFFELDQAVDGQVVLQADSDHSLIETAFISGETRQNLTIAGLRPGEEYAVLIIVDEAIEHRQPNYQGRAWGPLHFNTPTNDGTLRVGFISDASFGDERTLAMVEAMASADLDFVIHGGDVVDALEYGQDPFALYADAWYIPFELLLRQMPVYTVPGNHDYDQDIRYEERPFYYYVFPAFENALTDSPSLQYYAVIQNDIQFLFLDSQVLYGVAGLAEEEAWLDARLADESVRFSIPVVHVAPFSSSVVHSEDSLPVQHRWVPMFEDANVPLVLSGHFHHYERLRQNDISYLVAGGGSATLYALGTFLPQSDIALRTSHWVLLEFSTTEISITTFGVDGSVLDEFSIPLE